MQKYDKNWQPDEFDKTREVPVPKPLKRFCEGVLNTLVPVAGGTYVPTSNIVVVGIPRVMSFDDVEVLAIPFRDDEDKIFYTLFDEMGLPSPWWERLLRERDAHVEGWR